MDLLRYGETLMSCSTVKNIQKISYKYRSENA